MINMKYETLNVILCSPVTKKHCNLIGKENMIDPKLFERLGPYESLFLNKENKSMKKLRWTYLMNIYKYAILLCKKTNKMWWAFCL